MDIYSRVLPTMQKEAMSKMNNVFIEQKDESKRRKVE